jgi:proline racemase
MKRIPIIDSHTGGEPTRVVLGGVTADELETCRRAIICEPRGHEVIVGALLVEPKDATCATGVIFFNNVGLLGMCGHGMIGLIATLKHLGRITAGEHRVETPVGIVTATLHDDGRVSIRNVPSYRKAKGVKAGGVTGDVAWGGNWFFLVSDHGLDLTLKNVPQLTQSSLAMREAVRAAGYPEVDHIELFGHRMMRQITAATSFYAPVANMIAHPAAPAPARSSPVLRRMANSPPARCGGRKASSAVCLRVPMNPLRTGSSHDHRTSLHHGGIDAPARSGRSVPI